MKVIHQKSQKRQVGSGECCPERGGRSGRQLEGLWPVPCWELPSPESPFVGPGWVIQKVLGLGAKANLNQVGIYWKDLE